MSYATQADMLAAVGADMLVEVSDFDGDGTADSDSIDAALAGAESKANSYLSAYLPISTVPEALRDAVVDIALHILRVRRDKTTEDSRLAFKTAIDWLTKIAASEVTLGEAAEDDETVDPGDPEIIAEDRVWSRSTTGGLF